MSLVYLGKKKYHTCYACGDIRSGDTFEWHLMMTKKIREICLKCAKRDYGRKYVDSCKERIGDV